jgi:hypothetical protein
MTLDIRAELLSRLERACNGCSDIEVELLKYMLSEVSVGRDVLFCELASDTKCRYIRKVRKLAPAGKILASIKNLISRGLVEEGFESYNLAGWARELLVKLCAAIEEEAERRRNEGEKEARGCTSILELGREVAKKLEVKRLP